MRVCELYALPLAVRELNPFVKLHGIVLHLFKPHALPHAMLQRNAHHQLHAIHLAVRELHAERVRHSGTLRFHF